MRINNKYSYFIILFILLGIIVYLYQTMQSSVTSTPLNNDTAIINSTESDTNTGDYQIYEYNQSSAGPSFTIQVPNSTIQECSASGCWDLNIAMDNKNIYVDFTKDGDLPISKVVDDEVTNFGSSDTLPKVLVKSGTMPYIYEIYQIDNSYLVGVIDIRNETEGYLAAKSTDINDVSTIEKIFSSINF